VNVYLVGAILSCLLAFTVIFTSAYHWLMFGSSLTAGSMTEALNYSVQTITTVGYGNWVPSGWDTDKEELQKRILHVKALSVPFMLVGGALFAVLIGIVSNVLSRR
jgi:hypothetical protein